MATDPQTVLHGAAAQRKGFPRSSCPYATESARSEWLAGWDEAKAREAAPFPVALTAEVTAALDAADRVMRLLVPESARQTPQQRDVRRQAEQAFTVAREAVDVIEAAAAVMAGRLTSLETKHQKAQQHENSGGGERAKSTRAGFGPEQQADYAAGGVTAAVPAVPVRRDVLAALLVPLTSRKPFAARANEWPWINRPRPGVTRPVRDYRR